MGPPLQGSPSAAEHSPQPPSSPPTDTRDPDVGQCPPDSQGAPFRTQPSPSLRLSSPVVDWPESAIPPPCSQAMTVSSCSRWGPWAPAETEGWHGLLAAPNSRNTPEQKLGGRSNSLRAWASGEALPRAADRLAPLLPPGQPGLSGQCGSLLEERSPSQDTAAAAAEWQHRPGNPGCLLALR